MRLGAFVVGWALAFSAVRLWPALLDGYRAAEERREIELLERMVDRA